LPGYGFAKTPQKVLFGVTSSSFGSFLMQLPAFEALGPEIQWFNTAHHFSRWLFIAFGDVPDFETSSDARVQ